MRDFDASFGLRRVLGKGGSQSAGALGQDARSILSRYLDEERPGAVLDDPLFTVTYQTMRGNVVHRRMSGQKLYKIVKALGNAHGIPTLHPHALRHACAVEMLRRTRNLAAVQQHLRHVDVNTTTIYARLLPQDMEEVAKLFDRDAIR